MKEEVFEIYKQISIGKNDICLNCRSKESKLTNPLSMYHIGKNFSNSKNTILFVGKNAYGEPGEIVENFLFLDSTDFGRDSLELKEEYSSRRAFYSYTNEIIKRHFGSYDNGENSVALTNIVKCNNQSIQDTTTFNTKKSCINDLGVIWKEIEVLKPKRIIFYTGRHYDEFIKNYKPKDCFEIIDIVDNHNECWFHRKYLNQSGIIICDILRTFHPQRKNKEHFVNKICNWLNDTKYED